MSKSFRMYGRAGLLAVALASVLGCGDRLLSNDSGNTSWLRECTDDNQCGSYVCQCHYCTDRCGGTLDCSRHPSEICLNDTPSATDASPSAGAAEIAACEASVDAVRAACVAEDPSHKRLCLYDAMRPLCTSGRTSFVTTIFDCLKMDACQSPSDPSAAGGCVRAALKAAATPDDHAFGALACGCSAEPNCDASEPSYSLANVMLMKESDVRAVTQCYQASGCGDNGPCVSSTPLAPAMNCP